MLGFVVGFFAAPQKYCYQAHCSIDRSQGATLYETEAPSVLISKEHLQGMAEYAKDSRLTFELLRKSISIDLTMTESIFTVTFSVAKNDYIDKIGTAFEGYSISYLNEKVKTLRNTLQISAKNYYKTHTLGKELLSGVLSVTAIFTFSYLSIVTINLFKNNSGKDEKDGAN